MWVQQPWATLEHRSLASDSDVRRLKNAFLIVSLLALLAPQGHAQTSKHPGAEAALARIVLERDFGDGLQFQSREAVTLAENTTVPGLHGLLFMRWTGASPDIEVMASVQWFQNREDLLRFYRAEKKRSTRGLRSIGNTVIWRTGDNSYLWTDGEHFVIGIGGSPAPPDEMLEAWLTLIESHPPDLARLPTDQDQ